MPHFGSYRRALGASCCCPSPSPTGAAPGVRAPAWLAYSVCSRSPRGDTLNRNAATVRDRRLWMREACRRENRITDVARAAGPMQSATFFSTTAPLVAGTAVIRLATYYMDFRSATVTTPAADRSEP